MLLNKVMTKERDEFRDLNSQLKHSISDLKASMCALKQPLSPVASRLRLLKIQRRLLSRDWLNYNTSRTPSLTGCLLLT